jgi:hypothetical protein
MNTEVYSESSLPIALHPGNPHYFIYKNKTQVLISSAEHYGGVINIDFDYKKYLHCLASKGMNYTRVFSGAYVEFEGAFDIQNNTLSPLAGKYLAPWKRVEEKGLYKDEKKFDLDTWDPKYFSRLKEFVSLAEDLGIIVEMTFFSSIYKDGNWQRNPFNPGNNINNLPGDLTWKKCNVVKKGKVLDYQKKMVEKITLELNRFSNVIYEIQNEPWTDHPVEKTRLLKTVDPEPDKGSWYKNRELASQESLDWQDKLVQVIVDTEKHLEKKHLIARNYTNFKHSIPGVHPAISILNFHYAWPEAVWMNLGWERAISFDESGFDGKDDVHYLQQAWQFILAGGAVFNHLDYSFQVGKEEGTGTVEAPGGGSQAFRDQLPVLKSFIESFDLAKMAPDFHVVHHSPGLEWIALSEPGIQYAIGFWGKNPSWVKLSLPAGKYKYSFMSIFNGEILQEGSIDSEAASTIEVNLPRFEKMVAMKITCPRP